MLDEFLDQMVTERLAFAGKGKNCDVYEKRLQHRPRPVPGFDKVPYCVYFYYVRIDNNGKIKVDHYLWPSKKKSEWKKPIPYKDVPDVILKMVRIARPSGSKAAKNKHKLHSNNFRRVPWKHKSYIAIFVDEVNWTFNRRLGARRLPSIAFDPKPTGCSPNHSFFDAKDLVLDVKLRHPYKDPKTGQLVRSDKRSAIYFVNHMKRNFAGDDLLTEQQTFKFNMNLKAKYANSSRVGAAIAFDPGGTNMGPPDPPPPS